MYQLLLTLFSINIGFVSFAIGKRQSCSKGECLLVVGTTPSAFDSFKSMGFVVHNISRFEKLPSASNVYDNYPAVYMFNYNLLSINQLQYNSLINVHVYEQGGIIILDYNSFAALQAIDAFPVSDTPDWAQYWTASSNGNNEVSYQCTAQGFIGGSFEDIDNLICHSEQLMNGHQNVKLILLHVHMNTITGMYILTIVLV